VAQTPSSTQRPSLEPLLASARAGEYDRYLAALLAPAQARPGLLALAAFAAELARIPGLAAREPAMGALRLQWWRDALLQESGRTGHPIADAVREAAAERGLSRELLLGMIDVRFEEVQAEAPADDAAFDAVLWASEGAQFALAGQVLGFSGPEVTQACAVSGRAYGLARLLFGLGRTLARGHQPLPRTRLAEAGIGNELLLSGAAGDIAKPLLAAMSGAAYDSLAQARQSVAKLPRSLWTAFLPLALVPSYLRALESRRGDPLRLAPSLAPFTHVGRIAAAHWLGRF
jgi:phytoene synthase